MRPEQARAARAILRLGVREVAEATGVTPNTVSRIEAPSDTGKRGPQRSTVTVLRSWYESKGIEFVEGGQVTGGPGVTFSETDV